MNMAEYKRAVGNGYVPAAMYVQSRLRRYNKLEVAAHVQQISNDEQERKLDHRILRTPRESENCLLWRRALLGRVGRGRFLWKANECRT